MSMGQPSAEGHTSAAMGSCLLALRRILLAPRDPAALAVFRMLFGGLACVSAVRFLAYSWVSEMFAEPRFFFHYWGFSWVHPFSPLAMHAVFVGIAVAALCIACGLFYRVAVATFFVAFTYVQLCDVTNYLNHYYLVSLLALLLLFLPLHRAWSVDAWLFASVQRKTLPAYCTYLLRFQVGVVYVFAGLAKATGDWLRHAQPLDLWLRARSDLPILGSLFELPGMAYLMSWTGFLFDTTVVLWLLWRKTRPYAYVMLLLFHTLTSLLFPIGMFPLIMTVAALVFFPSHWPRCLIRRSRKVAFDLSRPPVNAMPPATPRGFWVGMIAAGLFVVVQVILPLRTHIYGGNVLWHEQGMRFSWRVMCREKNGSITFLIAEGPTSRRFEINPERYLTVRQAREFATQPDLILQLAKHVGHDYEARTGHRVSVYAHAPVSLNGRRAELLLDPEVDLMTVYDGVARAPWVQAAPSGPPLHLRHRHPGTLSQN